MKLSAILKYSSIIVGVIITIILVTQNPILVILDGAAAATYFASISLKKKGK